MVKLKGKPKYKAISITEDLTLFERSVVKEWKKKTDERNEKELSDSNIVWKVRGSPKSGLYLKKISKK